jgi:flagellar protein FlaG
MNISPVGQTLSAAPALAPSAAGLSVGAGGAPAPAGNNGHALPVGTTAAAGGARDEQLQQAVDSVNKFIEPAARNLEFEIDAQSGRTVMKLVDKETGSVLRQLPTEEMLAIARALDKLSGLVIRLKA